MNVRRLRSLISSLADEQPSLVWNVARELATYGTAASEALPSLERLLSHSDPNTSLWGRFAIAKITNDLPLHMPFFMAALKDRQSTYPGMAETAIAGFGPEAVVALDVLIERLDDPDPDRRWATAWAIGAMGDVAAKAVPELARMVVGDSDEKARWYAAFALSEMSGPVACPALNALKEAFAHDFDDDVRAYAARALGKIGDASAIAVLEVALDSENLNLRQEIEVALSRLSNSG